MKNKKVISVLLTSLFFVALAIGTPAFAANHSYAVYESEKNIENNENLDDPEDSEDSEDSEDPEKTTVSVTETEEPTTEEIIVPKRDIIRARNINLFKSGKKRYVKIKATHNGTAKLRYRKVDYVYGIGLTKDGRIIIPKNYTGTFEIEIYTNANKYYKAGSKTITVNVKAPYIYNKKEIVYVGSKGKVGLKNIPTSKKLRWRSSNRKVATIDAKGNVKALSAGYTTISVKYLGMLYYTWIEVKDVRINRGAISIAANETCQLKVFGRAVKSWSSSNRAVATVSKTGEVKGKAGGTATITGKTGTGRTFTCDVTVGTSEKVILKSIKKLEKKYPTGTKWDSSSVYMGAIYGGSGCHGFAMMLSDAAFGQTKVGRYIYDFNKIRIGDVVRVNNNTHTIICIGVVEDGIIAAEGNASACTRWGSLYSWEELYSGGIYVLTRY